MNIVQYSVLDLSCRQHELFGRFRLWYSVILVNRYHTMICHLPSVAPRLTVCEGENALQNDHLTLVPEVAYKVPNTVYYIYL